MQSNQLLIWIFRLFRQKKTIYFGKRRWERKERGEINDFLTPASDKWVVAGAQQYYTEDCGVLHLITRLYYQFSCFLSRFFFVSVCPACVRMPPMAKAADGKAYYKDTYETIKVQPYLFPIKKIPSLPALLLWIYVYTGNLSAADLWTWLAGPLLLQQKENESIQWSI